jgi:hypothetical protein
MSSSRNATQWQEWVLALVAVGAAPSDSINNITEHTAAAKVSFFN